VDSRLDKYITSKIDGYFERSDAGRPLNKKLGELEVKFNQDDFTKPATKDKTTVYTQYIFANLEKHKVMVVLNKRYNAFNIQLCVNNSAKSCSTKNSNLKQDIIPSP
jgi:hypothetical protein